MSRTAKSATASAAPATGSTTSRSAAAAARSTTARSLAAASRRRPLRAVRYVDVRGTRFGAALSFTGAVAAIGVVLVAPPLAAGIAPAALAAVLLASAWGGPRLGLWGHLYRATLARRLRPPTPAQREPETPPRFSNLLGGLFLAAAALAGGAGAPLAAVALAGIVAFLAFLNAAFGFCLGCRLYGLLVRDSPVATALGLRLGSR